MAAMTSAYPAQLEVDAPAPQNRLSVFFRIIFAIPIAIFMALVGIGISVVTLIAWVVILITGKYPAGMLDFAANGLKLSTRVNAYIYLLTDKYPSFSLQDDESYPVRPSVSGQVDGRNRLTVFFRIIMLIPHVLILYVLQLVLRIVGFIAWVAALITGSVPVGLHGFIEGILRWQHRVSAYALLLTDEYPPFSLN